MVYLKKSERQNGILKSAKKIVEAEGLAAVTARRVALEANMAVGQVHHHFKSIGELRAETLLVINRDSVEQIEKQNINQPVFNKLVNFSAPLSGELNKVRRRIWNEVIFLADRDAYIRDAYQYCMEEWHNLILLLLNEGITAGDFTLNDPSGFAWQLISLSCGLDSLMVLDMFQVSDVLLKESIVQFLKQGLFQQN